MKTIIRIGCLTAVIAVVIACSGCSTKVTNLSLVSVENIDLSQTYTLVAKDASAKVNSLWFLFYTGISDMSYYAAIGDCLAENNGDLMTDVKVTLSSFYFIIGFFTEYRIKGNVWRRADSVAAALPSSEVYTLEDLDDGLALVSYDGTDVRLVNRLH